MPRFSVIVPAYKVQAYLPACLESVLSQSYEDLELIVVDDRSPDACGEIADEFAARDPRLRTVHLARNKGLGPARNAGISEATGDYLVFLDGDDTLTPHALRAIADRLKETGEPDVLLYDHALAPGRARSSTTPSGGSSPSRAPPLPPGGPPGAAAGTDGGLEQGVPQGIRRQRGLRLPARPPRGPALDLPGPDDRRVDRHPGPGLRPPPAAPKEPGLGTAGHLDIFDQYDRVFAHVDACPELARWRPVLFRHMVDDLWAVFAGRDRLPPGSRAEFLRRARDRYRAHRTPGHPVPVRSWLRHKVIQRGLYRTYRVVELARRLRQRATRPVVRLARALRAVALRLHYRVQLRLPLREDRAVFAAYGGRGHGCNPGALEEAFRTFAPHIRTAWIARPEHHHTIPTATLRLRPGTAAYWTALARSKYLVNNTDFDRRLVKRPGQVLVQTQHGTPLKHMGLDLQERPAAAGGLDFGEMLSGVDQWDHLLSPNRHTTLTWERVFPGGYTMLPYGYPRNDVFQRATSEDVRRLRESLGIPAGSVAILYAPTHRDYRRTQRTTLDLDRLLRRLGPRFVVLARAHHRHGGPLVSPATGRVIDVSDHPSVESLCLASDALVTDYSSLLFDYANLDRPIVIHADDHEAYEAARGTYFDVRSFAPGAVARSEDELTDIFATGHWRGSRSTQLRSAFRARFCPYDDGRAAERVVRHVVLGETELPPVIPLAERHPVPSAAAALDRFPLATVPLPATGTPVTETH